MAAGVEAGRDGPASELRLRSGGGQSKSKSNAEQGGNSSSNSSKATPTAATSKKSVYGRTPDGTGQLALLSALDKRATLMIWRDWQSSRFHRRIMSSPAFLTQDCPNHP